MNKYMLAGYACLVLGFIAVRLVFPHPIFSWQTVASIAFAFLFMVGSSILDAAEEHRWPWEEQE